MKSFRQPCLLILVLILFLTGCVHHTPFVEEAYFQAMGDPAELVVTMDVDKSKRLYGEALTALPQQTAALVEGLLERAQRISVAFYEPESSTSEVSSSLQDKTTANLGSYAYYGGIEGNFSKFVINTALLWSPGWEKVENETTHYYRNGTLGLDVAVARNGILLFSKGDYMKAYETTYAKRVGKIPADMAKRMSSSMFGFYVASPKAMIDIGMEIPRTVLAQVRTMLLVIDENADGKIVLQGSIGMNTPKLANSLSILLKSAYIGEKRRARLPLGDMKNLFVLQEETVLINDMELTEKQLESFTTMFGSLMKTTGGLSQ
ncbi:MAG: hypothetical protein AB9828_09730 [Sphaerochaetaceae bacterium]